MPLYVGVEGKAREMAACFVGVEGKAREVQAIFVGVEGKARLVYSSNIDHIECYVKKIGIGQMDTAGVITNIVYDDYSQVFAHGDLQVSGNSISALGYAGYVVVAFIGMNAVYASGYKMDLYNVLAQGKTVILDASGTLGSETAQYSVRSGIALANETLSIDTSGMTPGVARNTVAQVPQNMSSTWTDSVWSQTFTGMNDRIYQGTVPGNGALSLALTVNRVNIDGTDYNVVFEALPYWLGNLSHFLVEWNGAATYAGSSGSSINDVTIGSGRSILLQHGELSISESSVYIKTNEITPYVYTTNYIYGNMYAVLRDGSRIAVGSPADIGSYSVVANLNYSNYSYNAVAPVPYCWGLGDTSATSITSGNFTRVYSNGGSFGLRCICGMWNGVGTQAFNLNAVNVSCHGKSYPLKFSDAVQ